MEVTFVSRRVSVDTFHRNFYQSDVGKFASHINTLTLTLILTQTYCELVDIYIFYYSSLVL